MIVNPQEFVSNPGEQDVTVSKVFTPEMFTELKESMNKVIDQGAAVSICT